MASWVGTIAYDYVGWAGSAGFALAMSFMALCMCVYAERQFKKNNPP